MTPPHKDDQDIYISFTHRELLPTVLVAMGLFNSSGFAGSNDVNGTTPLDQVTTTGAGFYQTSYHS
jgi:hypothetical protein